MVSDAAGRVTSMTDASGNTTSFTFDPNGNRLTSTDAAGKTTTFGYDKKNRLVSATDPQGNTTRTGYDGNSNVTARTDAKGSTTTLTYNKGNQLVKTVDALGNAVRQGYCADVGCPSCGGAGTNGVCSATDALGNTTVTRFDAMGRNTETISPTGSVTATQYDSLGRQSKTIDALGNETRLIYDDLGRLWKVIDALGGVTEYGFDERGNRTSVKDANGGVTTYQYDLENRLVSETNPIGITTTYTYTPTGRRATKTDGNGVMTTYTYTAEGRQSRVDFPDGTFKEYRFDEKGNKVYEANQDVVQTYEFDDLNRVLSYTQTNLGGISKTLRYEFDANGNRTKMIDAEGGATIYEYDRNNRLVKVTDPDGDVTRLEYDPAGRRSKLILGNGVWAEYKYDESSRVTSILYRSRTNEILMGFAYGHDLNGNRLYKRFADGTQETYSYDSANRLVHVTYRDGKFEDFSYDLLGNRIAHNKDGVVTTSAFNAFNQLLTVTAATGETTSFVWDGNGNLLSETSPAGVKSYLWDFDNRLGQVAMPDGTTSFYTYAASGLRVNKVENGVVTQQLLDGPSVTTEYDESGLRKAFYLQNPQKIDEFFYVHIVRDGQAGNLWPIVDALGSVYAMTDYSGGIAAEISYLVFGGFIATGNAVGDFLWQGRERNRGGYYFRQRYYNEQFFVSADTVDRVPNAYYVFSDNPVNLTDPFGTSTLGYLDTAEPMLSANGYRLRLAMATAVGVWDRTKFTMETIIPGRDFVWPGRLKKAKCNVKIDDCSYCGNDACGCFGAQKEKSLDGNGQSWVFYITLSGLMNWKECKLEPYRTVFHEWVHASVAETYQILPGPILPAKYPCPPGYQQQYCDKLKIGENRPSEEEALATWASLRAP
jgi:YD repeat-containing protein